MEFSALGTLIPAAAWCVALCWMDWRERRLPNWLTIGGAVVALAWRMGYGGMPSFLNGFAAAAGAGALLLLPFLLRGAGGGDVKMLFAAGAIAGWDRLLNLLMLTSVAGLIMALTMLVVGRVSGVRLRHYVRCAWDWRYDRQAGVAALPSREDEKARVIFSIPIAVGLLGSLLV